VIVLESVHIEEVRGIRKLDLNLDKSNLAISGPNGSGKSGVIDAIEFGLTGEIKRLMGRGTRGLSLSEHGPHVDKTRFPDAAFVRLRVYVPKIGKSGTITRKVNSPKKPKIEPDDEDLKEALEEVAAHPEVVLSRREILRFILVEPSKRSEEIQALLKLEDVGLIRNALNTTQNRLGNDHRTADSRAKSHRNSLQLHLQIETLDAKDLLAVVNKRRRILDLEDIGELAHDTALDTGISEKGKPQQFNKESALRDLRAMSDAAEGLSDLRARESARILEHIKELEADPALFTSLQRRMLLEKGLELVDGPECPLCEQRLRGHLVEVSGAFPSSFSRRQGWS